MNQLDHQPEIIIRVGARPKDKREVVRQAARLLAEAGCVDENYADSMLRREETANTYLGSGVAIPHGTLEDKGRVRRDGLAVVQAPDGVDWGDGQIAKLIVGIAARGDSHIVVLRRLARLIQDEASLARLSLTTDAGEIKSALLRDEQNGSRPEQSVESRDLAYGDQWVLDYPAGLHARPATIWVEKAQAAGLPLRIRHDKQTADPRDIVALLGLGLKEGDVLSVSSEGDGAEAVVADFIKAISRLSEGEKAAAAKALAGAPARGGSFWQPSEDAGSKRINGVPAAPGLAVGLVYRLDAAEPEIPDKPLPLIEGGALLEEALAKTRLRLQAVADDVARRLGAAEAGIFKAHAKFLDDAGLIAEAARYMVNGHGPAWAWNRAVEDSAHKLAGLGNEISAARAADLRDVGRRVLLQLEPGLVATAFKLPEGRSIVVVRDLSPSDTANLEPGKVAGLATVQGGPTSHLAILARTLGLPAVVALGEELLLSAGPGVSAIIDGDGGSLWLNPSEKMLESARIEIKEREAVKAAQIERRAESAITGDGFRVEVAANVNTISQVPLALAMGAEGVGLMRTEFLFLERGDTPTEEQQLEIYIDMAKALEGRPLIVRALDIGGDKQVAHLNLPHEDNPFLGVRGARLLLRRKDLFEPQIRALYRAAKETLGLSIMFPMISTAPEIIELRRRCESLRAELNAPQLPLGIMVEVPAAALMTDILAKYADFFSIGTNDLTQYTLAIDRQNPELAAEADGLSPAVLRLIARAVEGAKTYDRMVGVCGGIAADTFGAALLIGLGVTELSMTPRDIPAIKDMIRRHDRQALVKLAQKALTLESAEEVRRLAENF